MAESVSDSISEALMAFAAITKMRAAARAGSEECDPASALAKPQP